MRIFIGPTRAQIPPGAEAYPPAQQGDIATAVLDGVKTIVLIDGLFTQHLAPWHKEILFAIQAGVRVVGAASLGALRGVECERYGMEVYGKIAEWYKDGTCTDDADVALAHADVEGDYEPASVPLVNILATCLALEAKGAITSAEKAVSECAEIYYPERNWSAIRHRVQEHELIRDWYIDQKKIDAEEAILKAMIETPRIPAAPSENAMNSLFVALLKNDTLVNGVRKWETAILRDEAFDFYALTELAMNQGVVASDSDIQDQSFKMWSNLGIFDPESAAYWMAINGISDQEWNKFAIRKAIRQNVLDWFNSTTCGSEVAPLAIQFQAFNNK